MRADKVVAPLGSSVAALPFSSEIVRFDVSGEVLLIGPRASFGRLQKHSVEYADRAAIWFRRIHAHPEALARLRTVSSTWWHDDTHNRLSDTEIVERVLAELARGPLAAFLIPQADTHHLSRADPSRVASALANSPVTSSISRSMAGAPGGTHARHQPRAPQPVGSPAPFGPASRVTRGYTLPILAKSIALMSVEERLVLVLRKTVESDRLSSEAKSQLTAMLAPERVMWTVGALAVWALSHWVGVGFAFDALMFAYALYSLPDEAMEGIKSLRRFAKHTLEAKNEGDLDKAADALAVAIVVLGIRVLQAVVRQAHARPKPVEKAPQRILGKKEEAQPKPQAAPRKSASDPTTKREGGGDTPPPKKSPGADGGTGGKGKDGGGAKPVVAPPVQTLDPNEIRFSQKTVSFAKKDKETGQVKYTRDDLVDSMKKDGWKGDPVDVVRMPDGKLTSIDNTRISAARETSTPVQARVRSHSDPLTPEESQRFSEPKVGPVPKTWGEAVSLRVDKQGGTFSKQNPQGSPNMPRVSGKPPQ